MVRTHNAKCTRPCHSIFLFCKAIYIIARISMLLHIFAITINRNALHEVPCTQLTFMSKCTTLIRNSTLCVIINLPLVCDALGTVASSLILVLRTRAVWRQDIKITILMGVLLLGQIAVWSQSALSSTSLVGHAHPLIGFSHKHSATPRPPGTLKDVFAMLSQPPREVR